jgi:hypothetical protein
VPADAEWIKQLVAEQLVTVKTRRGFTRLEWQKLRERTRHWTAGCTRAPPPGLPVPTAGRSANGGELEMQVAPAEVDETAATEAAVGTMSFRPPAALTVAPRRHRRVFRSSYLS